MEISCRTQCIRGWIMRGFLIPSVLIIVLGGLLGVTQASEAQKNQLSEVTLSMQLYEASVIQALHEIEKETEFTFAFNYDQLNLNRTVTVEAQNRTVEEVLKLLFQNTGVTWGLSGNVVLLRAEETPEEEPEEYTFLFQEVTGRVTDSETGEPLPGVNIIVVGSEEATGTTIGTQTDPEGMFTIRMPDELNSLMFTFIGYQTVVEEVAGRSVIDIAMTEDIQVLEDIVVVGYGRQERINLTGAVDQISSRDLANRPIRNLTQGLQGVMPNVNINIIEGKPTHSPDINIRGTTSIGAEGSALVLIDGVEGDLSLLNPNDIESISVLKDASASAVYGARGAFGVVLVTTKQPAQDELTINYSGSIGMNQPTVDQSQMVTDGLTWANMFVESFVNWGGTFPQNANKTLPFSQDYLEEIERRSADPGLEKTWIADDGSYRYAHNTDWYGLLYNSRMLTTDQNLSVSGSSGNVDFQVSGRIQHQDGLIRLNPDDYQMINLRARGGVNVTDWLRFDSNFSLTNRSYFEPLNCCDGEMGQLDIALEGFPLAPLYNPDGTLTHSGAYALGGYATGTTGVDWTYNTLRNKTEMEAALFDDRLRVVADIAYQQTDRDEERKRIPVSFSRVPGVMEEIGSNLNWIQFIRRETNFMATNAYAEFHEIFSERHDVRAVLGYNYEQERFQRIWTRRDGLILPDARDIELALGENQLTRGGYHKWANLGGFYRLNYIFDERYLFEFTGRYDGSSKFPENERYGFFPSASLGWRISSEPFWNVSDELISHLQLRASYGSMGNGNVPPYEFEDTFSISQSDRILGDRRPQTTRNPTVLPQGLTWETVTTRNLGIDLEMLSGKLSFTGDVYTRETTDMFTQALTPPAIFGASPPQGNYADLETKGWEMMLTWRDQFSVSGKPLQYNIRLSLADHQAEITRYNNPDKFLNDHYEGKIVGEIWGYETDGFFTDQADIDNHADQSRFRSTVSGQYHPGDIKLRDLNGDGVIDPGANTAEDPGDRRVIGNTTPRYTFGVNLGADWNNVFVSAFFQGVGKRDWYPSREANFWGQYNRPYNQIPVWHLDDGIIWSEENPDSFFPRYVSRIASSSNGILSQPQTGYLMNAAYIRLKSLQVGYHLPQSLLSQFGMRSATIYFAAENLWAWSPLYKTATNLDIENTLAPRDTFVRPGDSFRHGYNYPLMRNLTLGVNITF